MFPLLSLPADANEIAVSSFRLWIDDADAEGYSD